MDTITHGITGSLFAHAFFSERHGRIATLLVTAGSLFPDSDTLARWFYDDRIAFLRIHRGLTHSVVMLPAFAMIFGALACLCLRNKQKWLLYSLLFGTGIASHILLDVITSFGTMVWSPLNYARVSWDITFIIDLFFSSIVLLPQLAAWVYSERQKSWWRGGAAWLGWLLAVLLIVSMAAQSGVHVSSASLFAAAALVALLLWLPSRGARDWAWRPALYSRAGVAALALYMGMCALAHRAALEEARRFVQQAGMEVERIAALPSPPSLLRWSGLVSTPKGIYRASINLAASQAPSYDFYPHAERNLHLRTAESLPDAQTYLWFARFPWVTYESSDGINVVEIRDLQFIWRPRSANPPFTFQVLLDREGRVLRSGLLPQ